MEIFAPLGPPELWLFAYAIALGAGVVKGVVGFAMPLILLSGLSSFVAPDLALACLIVPTLLTNAWQALRQGSLAAAASIRRFHVYLLAGGVALVLSAQLVPVLSASTLLLIIAVPLVIYAAATLAGHPLRLPLRPGRRLEAALGGGAGFIGGLSGVWGPITVAMLTAMETEKREQVRVQGVIYGLGAIALAGAHVASGVLNAQTLPLSLALVPPALLGIWTGFQIQDRIDQTLFKRLTLWILLIAGLNLLRRGLITL
ncbi:sulfite exporter TauE/SafE family protein [Roseovarius sp. Pro17]|uniref:sulfite exporter TauE/SafE family protein n=1 Tax=Roseovarius sp. Pro17 TaxID=3108175 RepID=UPI002D786F64|nr:sulfite exporter TauE/SafE family protein [Roseovarius sp. Pro17]